MTKRFTSFLIAGFICVIFGGCTAREWFESMKEIQRQDCYKNESPSERQECLNTVDGWSYGQYKREREEAVAKKPEQE